MLGNFDLWALWIGRLIIVATLVWVLVILIMGLIVVFVAGYESMKGHLEDTASCQKLHHSHKEMVNNLHKKNQMLEKFCKELEKESKKNEKS